MILLILFVRFMDPIIHHQILQMKNVYYATVVDTNLSTVLNILITIYVNAYRSQIQRCRQRYFPSINIRPVFVGLPLHLLKFPSLRLVIFGTSPSTNKTTTSISPCCIAHQDPDDITSPIVNSLITDVPDYDTYITR